MSDTPDKNKTVEYDLRLKEAELTLRASKEIVAKFIETGRVSPTSFEEVFSRVFEAVTKAVSSHINRSS
ncbi:MAG: hypothetical protein M0022_03075 [Desulfobacteraceae bacterium]|nr:hypothetical protein [Desulfobacteraceae bacterium]